jgi:hypothetical protein
VTDRNYFVRQAATLLKLARSTKNRDVAVALIEKATDLKSRLDETSPAPDISPRPPDVQTGT